MLKTFFRILSPLFLGLFLFIFFVQESVNVQSYLSERVSTYIKKNYNIDMKLKDSKFHFFDFSFFASEILLNIGEKDERNRVVFQNSRLNLFNLASIINEKLCFNFRSNRAYAYSGAVRKTNSSILENITSKIELRFSDEKKINYSGKFSAPLFNNYIFTCHGCYSERSKFLNGKSSALTLNVYSENDSFVFNLVKSDDTWRGNLNFLNISTLTLNFSSEILGASSESEKIPVKALGIKFNVCGDRLGAKLRLATFHGEPFNGYVNLDIKSQKGEFFISNKKFSTKGFLVFKDGKLSLKGRSSVVDYLLEMNCFSKTLNTSPEFYFKRVLCFRDKKKLVDLKVSNNSTSVASEKILSGTIDSDFVKQFLPSGYRRLFLTNKLKFDFEVSQNSFNSFSGKIGFKDGAFYIPNSFNLIENFNLNFFINLSSKEIKFEKIHIDFHKGDCLCDSAILKLDDDFSLLEAYAPFKVNDLLINIERDFYGFTSGRLLIQKKCGDFLTLDGNLNLIKSVIKNNFISNGFAADETSYIDLLDSEKVLLRTNINIRSDSPVKISTDFLKAEACVDINMKNINFKNGASYHQFLGGISLERGELKFLHNKLYIEEGKIEFMPNRLGDVSINLTAKNKIKKYFIIMKINGSLHNMSYSFESSPYLTEERILALLMAGSENADFQTDIPALLLQNLNNWVTENKNVLLKTKKFFRKITLPFKYIQITPDFSDQSGRGGVKGVVSIALDKQFHAKIQKNFNLQEDFAFQIEYFLSDDINLKFVKDQRGDLGSEVEFRFKF